MKVFLIKVALFIFGLLPLWLARALGILLGEVTYRVNAKSTRTARINIQHCFPDLPEEARRVLLRKSMQEWGKTVFEALSFLRRNTGWLESKITGCRDEQVLTTALSSGKGVILLSGHVGNWEVLRVMTGYRAMTSLYLAPKNKWLDQIISTARQEGGIKMVPASGRGVLKLVEALRQGELSLILPDQTPIKRSSGIYAPFFGLPALTITLVEKLLRRDVTVVMVSAIRRKGGFELVFAEPDPEIYSTDREQSVAALNRSIEAQVMVCPEQYQWEYKRFKKQPKDQNDIYSRQGE